MITFSFKKFEVKRILKTFNFFSQKILFTFLLLFLVEIILGWILFFKYFVLIQKKPLEIKKEPIRFERRIYDKVLKIWEERELKFNQANNETFPNLFLRD
jgi:hypothetical protein